MESCILCIGNELLVGKTINSNAAWIGRKITIMGCDIRSHITIPDEENMIISTLNNLISNNLSLIIMTGGLGPTDDDITTSALFKFANVSSSFDSEYWELLKNRFQKHGMRIPESNRSQARVPSKGEVIGNPIGSARGFKLKVGGTIIFSLPGVPNEMMGMMRNSVFPWLKKNSKSKKYIKILCTTGIPESVLIEKISDQINKDHGCTLGYYPSVYGLEIQISSKDKEKVALLFNILLKKLNEYVYGEDGEKIEEVVVRNAQDLNLSIAIAESCTGGLIGDKITNVSGSSSIFNGGIVSYSNESKIKVLGVKKQCIQSNGAVSEDTAMEMADNIRRKFFSDIGLSVTGIAGPGGGTNDRPIGLVFIGISNKNGVKAFKMNFGKNRINNKERTCQAALDILRKELKKYE